MRVEGLGFRGLGLRFRVWVLGLGVWAEPPESETPGRWRKMLSSGLVQGVGFRVEDLGLRVQGFRLRFRI